MRSLISSMITRIQFAGLLYFRERQNSRETSKNNTLYTRKPNKLSTKYQWHSYSCCNI